MYMFSVTRKIRVSRALLLILYVLFIICGCLSIWLQLALVVKNELILQIVLIYCESLVWTACILKGLESVVF